MEVRQLKIFSVLAEELNFTRAAQRVNTVQSNVTAQIKSLEEELGIPLFDRVAKKVVLTEAGRRFLPYADRALAAMDQGQQAVRFGLEPAGPLRIGAPESVLTYRLPQVVQRFRRQYPRVELAFRPQPDEALSQWLDHGRLDMAIRMGEDALPDRLTGVHLRVEPILLLSDPAHPLAAQSVVAPEDLAGQTLLLTESGCGYRLKLETALRQHNIRPGSILEFSSVEAIKHCVAAGMGIGLLPLIVVEADLKKGTLAELRWNGPPLDVTTYIFWHKDRWMSPSMEAFLSVLTKALDRN